MKKAIEKIIEKFQENEICFKIDFLSEEWRKKVPADSGWYLIKTNAPINILRNLNNPKGKAHYNIGNRIDKNFTVDNNDLLINQKENNFYVVYNGHAKNLKARAREHYRGHNKTACLSLKQYKEIHEYDWYFCFLSISSLDKNYKADKLLRLAVEQAWRSKFGWPILCKG